MFNFLNKIFNCKQDKDKTSNQDETLDADQELVKRILFLIETQPSKWTVQWAIHSNGIHNSMQYNGSLGNTILVYKDGDVLEPFKVENVHPEDREKIKKFYKELETKAKLKMINNFPAK